MAIVVQAIGGNLFTIFVLKNLSGPNGVGFLAGVALISVFWIGSYIFLFASALSVRYGSKYKNAEDLLDTLTTSQSFPEFMTLMAYDQLR